MDEQRVKIVTNSTTCAIENLYLDPNNYRFIDKPDYQEVPETKIADPQVQKRTRGFLLGKNNEQVADLISSLKKNGFLPVDQIQVKALDGGNFLVLEGNRRVATLKYLYEEWENGADIGHLTGSDFKKVPVVLHKNEDIKNHLIVMGLKHISGNKKWNPVNQAQLIDDLVKNHHLEEREICDTLGITLHALRRYRRTLFLIERYKKSDYGDQFQSSMYSLFEEVIKKTEIKKWLAWEDDDLSPHNPDNEKRLFSWISKEENPIYNDEGEVSSVEIAHPIITKGDEIRELARFINDEKALDAMEQKRSITAGLVFSDALGESKFLNAIEQIKEGANSIFKFSEYMKEEHIQYIETLRDKLDRLIPTSRGRIRPSAATAKIIPGTTMQHFSEICIRQFRRLENVTLKKINRINILAGYNNSGKTSVLEAIFLLTRLNDLNGFFEMETYRAKFLNELNARWLDKSFSKTIELGGVFNGKAVNLTILNENTTKDIDKSGYLSTFELISEYDGKERSSKAHLFYDKESQLYYEERSILCPSILTSPYRENERELKNAHALAVRNKAMDVIIEFIKNNIDAAIQKIEISESDGLSRFTVTSDEFEKSVDITSYGEGVQRVFEIALFFAYASNGVVLIDEFESAIHKSLLNSFSKFVHELAERFNVQVFLTSHSKECIDAFITSNYHTQDIVAYVLKEEKGKITCKYVEGTRLATLIEAIDVDIRER